MTELEKIQKAFPVEIREEVNSLLTKFAVETKFSTNYCETVVIGEEEIKMPYRIHYNSPYSLAGSIFTQKEQEILNCIFSRHGNGYIRQKAIQNIIKSDNIWAIPYIVRIIGEYILEILDDIDNDFELINKSNLTSFVRQNPKFYNQTRARIISYYYCYWRRRFKFPEKIKGIRVPKEQRYVGFRLLNKIDKLINEK